jgi:hypothetical protein
MNTISTKGFNTQSPNEGYCSDPNDGTMITSLTSTRAEVNDVANSVMDSCRW